MKTALSVVLAVLSVFVLGGLANAGQASGKRGQIPGDVIVEVTGDAANGFGIHYADGSALFPPTDSEAAAECSEYSTSDERLVCATEVRIWYRDLAELQRSLLWAGKGAR